jgi:hypothetical protein
MNTHYEHKLEELTQAFNESLNDVNNADGENNEQSFAYLEEIIAAHNKKSTEAGEKKKKAAWHAIDQWVYKFNAFIDACDRVFDEQRK